MNNGSATLQTSNPTDVTTINGNYTTKGLTQLHKGVLALYGTAKQEANTSASFQLLTGTTVALTAPGGTLDIKAGHIAGTGTVQGSLTIGSTDQQPLTAWISPGSVVENGVTVDIGHIHVTGNFQMFSGEMHIQVAGPNQNQYDRITVDGYAALSGAGSGGTLVGILLPVHAAIPAGTPLTFLNYGSRIGDFTNESLVLMGPNWASNKDATTYWLYPTINIDDTTGGVQ